MATKLWGEFEDDPENDQQNVNFNPIIELGMQNIPEIPITVETPPVQLPEPNLFTHTIQLHEYYRELKALPAIIEKGLAENMTPNLVHNTINNFPPQPKNMKLKHNTTPGLNFLPKVFNDFTAGKGPVILPFTNESHQRALKQSAATALAFVGASSCMNSVVEAMADALDVFMSKFCRSLRVAVDRQASNIPSGFPDPLSRVLHDFNLTDLGNWYQNCIVSYNTNLQQKCRDYAEELQVLADVDNDPQELEEVPELHFPAALEGSFTPSLETGFQMLQNLERENLDGYEFMENDGQQSKPEPK